MILGILLLPLLTSLVQGRTTDHFITLPWGTWKGNLIAGNNKIYKFQNVRFGATPIRFGLSSTPAEIADNSTIQDSSFGPGCYAINPKMLKIGKGESDIGSPITIPSPSDMPMSEDCLFLDIYVPASAFEPNAPKLPVVVWFYGGAYAFGSKQNFGPDYPEFYSGQGLMEQNDLIFVAGNYRLGAFGWLAGSYMEGKEVGVPNAGFYDQRLLLQWVRDWIDKVGGDNTKVSAWGESAGAGSILHHLVQKGGKRDPLFTKAMLQSPAFQWQWDREGTLDTVFQNFSSLSGCGFTKNITCLRTANITRLVQANHDLFLDVKNTGLFPVGPSVDKIWMDDLPAVAFSQNAYWDQLESIMVSHVGNEAGGFTPKHIKSNKTFQEFLHNFMPEKELSDIKTAIQNKYNCQNPPYNGDYHLCASTLIRDSSFTCNTRQLYDAYKRIGKDVYMMQYNFPGPRFAPAVHATDLVPTFINNKTKIVRLLQHLNVPLIIGELIAPFLRELRGPYQKYLSSYAVFGNPNMNLTDSFPAWPIATDNGDKIMNTLEVEYAKSNHQYFDVTSDIINTHQICGFWNKVAIDISKIKKGAKHSMMPFLVQRPEL